MKFTSLNDTSGYNDSKKCPSDDGSTFTDELQDMEALIQMRQGADLLTNKSFCCLLMQMYLSLHWFFNKDKFNDIYHTCQAAKRNEKKKLLEIQRDLKKCNSRTRCKTIDFSEFRSTKEANNALLGYQLDASRHGIKNVQGLFQHCLGNNSKTASTCASEVPSVEELAELSNDGLSFMIVYLLEMILELHIIKEKLSLSTRRKRAFVWLKTKPCALTTCMMCGLKGDMCWDHIFSSHCSRNFAQMVQECLSEWPDTTNNVILNWVYAKMYQDVPQLDMLMHLKNKARELERAVASV